MQFPGPGTIVKAINHPDLEIVTSWDEDPDRGKDRSSRLGIDFEKDLDRILESPEIDGVLVSSATSLHKDIICRAAQHGKHVHSAKVLAPTLREAREIVSAADDAGIVLVTDMGWLYKDYVLQIKEIMDSGMLGKIANVRLTHFHSMASYSSPVDKMGYYPDVDRGFLKRSEGCGGALVDMCHPTYVTPYLCGGLPTSAYARFGSISKRGDVEDNAVVIFDYDDGPYAIVEASWVTPPMTTEIEVNGTRGSLLYRSVYGIPTADTFVMRSADESEFRKVELQKAGTTPLDIWVSCIRNGTRADENVERALDLSLMNEAAYRSAESGMPMSLNSVSGQSEKPSV
jgi:predicted dehydrogenase